MLNALPFLGFLLAIFCSLNSYALDRIVLRIDFYDSETVYHRIPLTAEPCYQENAHTSKQKITICGEGILEGLVNTKEYVVTDVPGRDCAGYSFLNLDLNDSDPSVQFDLLRQDNEIETTLKYDAKLCYDGEKASSVDLDNSSINLRLHDTEHARVAEIHKNNIKEALNTVRNNIQEQTKVSFSDVEIADFTCDKSFSLICTKDRVIHRAPHLSMTGYLMLH